MLPKPKATLIYTHDGKYFSALVYLEYKYFLCASSYIKKIVTSFYPGCGMFSVFSRGRGSYLRQLAVWALRLGQSLYYEFRGLCFCR